LLDIPISHHVVAPIAIGYPRTVSPPAQRRVPDIVWIGREKALAPAATQLSAP
jgi:hypothetical protein